MATQDNYTRVTVRIPPELHDALKDVAESSERSVNAEVISRLTRSLQIEHNANTQASDNPLDCAAASAADIQNMAQLILNASTLASKAIQSLRDGDSKVDAATPSARAGM